MNESTTAHSTTTRRPSLRRRVDGVELPVAGTWYVPGNHSTITFYNPRRMGRPQAGSGRASQATLQVAADPDRISVSIALETPTFALAGGPRDAAAASTRLEAQAIGGRDPWTMSGRMFTAAQAFPVRADLSYHGTWHGGRDDRDYAWFVLTARIDVRQRWRNRMEFSFDLLAYGPEADSASPLRARHGSNTQPPLVQA